MGNFFRGLLIQVWGHTTMGGNGRINVLIELEGKVDKKCLIFLEGMRVGKCRMGSGAGRV